MVEVFATNVGNPADAQRVVTMLSWHFPALLANFDLEDCDRILRLEGQSIDTSAICKAMEGLGFLCKTLE